MWPASWSTDISRSYQYTGAPHKRKNIVAVITQDRVIDDNLKRQMKNRTLDTRIFQYISNCFDIYLPTLFLQYARKTIFQLIMQVYIEIGLTLFYLSFLVHFQLWHYLYKATLHQGSYFFWCSFTIKLSWLQRRSNKINTILYDRYYLQNCKAITFEKIANHTKCKKPNVPSHLHIF